MTTTPERAVIESLFRIADKDGNDVDFILNSAQAKLDSALTGRDLVPKARQEGVSSYVLARYTVKCLGQRNTRAVVISHDKESTQRMLAKVRYYLNNFRGPSPIIKNDSKNEITFPKTNSAFYIGTAGSRQFGRGDTITHLHCSEIAYWPDPKSLTAGLFQAVPNSGEIIIESTGNGVGNYYHQMCMRAVSGMGRYRLHFLDWQSFPEYVMSVGREEEASILSNLITEFDEPFLVQEFGLSASQLLWRRYKLEEMGYDLRKFKQEYPLTLDECFQASGHSIFQIVNYKPTKEWKQYDQYMHILEGHPYRDKTYVIGADVSAGVEKDASAMEVICLEDEEQVAEWRSNKVSPDIFAHKLAAVGMMFNEAFTVVESNNHGIATLLELRSIYPSHKIYKETKQTDNQQTLLMALGQRTTVLTKPIFISRLRQLLATDLVIHSEVLRNELSTFVEDEYGKLGAEEGCFDDTVIAAAKAVMGMARAALLNELPLVEESKRDPFQLETIINEMHGRKEEGFPIREQTIIDGDAYPIDVTDW